MYNIIMCENKIDKFTVADLFNLTNNSFEEGTRFSLKYLKSKLIKKIDNNYLTKDGILFTLINNDDISDDTNIFLTIEGEGEYNYLCVEESD